MHTFSPKEDKSILETSARILGIDNENISRIEHLEDGRNSSVYKITTKNGKQFITKKYYCSKNDNRDRLKAEFESLTFLWKQGFRSIPFAISSNREKNVGVYQYIEGKKISGNEISTKDIDEATSFLLRLYKLKSSPDLQEMPLASDACFSFVAMEHIIERRLSRLLNVSQNEPKNAAMHLFLTAQFIPTAQKILRWCKDYAKSKELGWETEFTSLTKTLSPSDFGFHNALRELNGNIIFYDFEYFGWDDITKMIIDFLLHPGMELSEECKQRFIDNIISELPEETTLQNRLQIAFPLLSLVWCLILLNEFLPEYLQRRILSKKINLNLSNAKENVLHSQLCKAEQALVKAEKEYNHFPYYFGSTKKTSTSLDKRSKELRKNMITVFEKGKRGHLPSAFSVVEILRVLYDNIMKYDKNDPKSKTRDRFILSKGHACLALYVLLEEKGFFPKEELGKFCKIDGLLGGHPECKIPGVELATGSLGHGLPVGVGIALKGKKDHESYKVFVVLGDGECNEGSIWEAALCAPKHKLDNLVVIIDYNKQMTYGTTFEIQDLEPLAEKWRSFGFSVKEVDGHSILKLKDVFQTLPFEKDKPSLLICHTIKGKGISFLEKNYIWHHKSNVEEQEISDLYKGLEEYP